MIGAAVVLYKTSSLPSIITKLASDHNLTSIYLIDNTGCDAIEQQVYDLSIKYSKIKIIRNSSNLGLAINYNLVAYELIKLNYKYLFIFDQDSDIEDSYISLMLHATGSFARFGILAPLVLDKNTNKTQRITSLNRLFFSVQSTSLKNMPTFIKTDFVISSGSLLNLSVLNQIGGYDVSFFVDHVDTDYCMMLKKRCEDIYIVTNAILHHEIGKRTVKKIFGLSIFPNNHNSFRRRNIAKNSIFLLKKHSQLSFWTLIISRIFYESITILIFEDNKINKLSSIFLGLIDGISTNKSRFR